MVGRLMKGEIKYASKRAFGSSEAVRNKFDLNEGLVALSCTDCEVPAG